MKKYIWLFGENEGKTKNNNSYYFWKHTVFRDKNIEKYFILEKNKKHEEFYKRLNENVKKYIIWRNSIKHWKLYEEADMLFVSLSYKDVAPSKIMFKDIKRVAHAPVIYLQHGTTAIKKLGYKGNGYNNNFFRFCVYNPKMLDIFPKENDFEPYQLYYAEYHPRYIEMIKRYDEYNKSKHNNKTILYFLTWREYFGENSSSKKMIKDLIKLATNPKIIKFLKDNNYIFKFCVHQFFDNAGLDELKNLIDNSLFKIVYSNKTDVMDELVSCSILITDYSSVGFECTLLNKPVILYTPDLKQYLKNRELYCSVDELKKYSIDNLNELIDTLISKKYKINNFYKSRLPKDIDFEYIRSGKHIEKMNDYFKEKCENKIAFIGYRYGGRGGTVSATKSLVSGLMEKGYLVEMISLKGIIKDKTEFPKGVNERKLSEKNGKIYTKLYEKLKKEIRFPKQLYYFENDSNKDYMVCDIGKRLKNVLDKGKFNTVVSTRESIHHFLNDTKNENIKNKIYFFHTDADACNIVFPGIKFDDLALEKCAFVTVNNFNKYKEKYSLNPKVYSIIGNCISSKDTIDVKEIKKVKKSKLYKGICLLRLSKDRQKDINNIIKFGLYLKDNKVNNILIDVYGTGNYEKEFKNLIVKNKLKKYINFAGMTNNSKEEIISHDFLVDFSVNQSFGMIYLEGILNGKQVFCTRNDGSSEVLKDLEYCFYNDYKELANKISDLDKISLEQLQNNYKIIYNRYSQETITNKFIELVEKGNNNEK